ncbi:hypothetical protein ATANTOWER_018691, partial [Ataeniobius toweri]|nr:hypothetical protein [Ataeniobius toweri]
GESVIFQGMELKGQVTVNDSVFRNLHGAAAVDIVVKEMRSRFMRFLSQSGHIVVYSSRIFNHDAWPERQDAPLDYGRGEIQVLIQHFGLEPPVVDARSTRSLRNGSC